MLTPMVIAERYAASEARRAVTANEFAVLVKSETRKVVACVSALLGEVPGAGRGDLS